MRRMRRRTHAVDHLQPPLLRHQWLRQLPRPRSRDGVGDLPHLRVRPPGQLTRGPASDRTVAAHSVPRRGDDRAGGRAAGARVTACLLGDDRRPTRSRPPRPPDGGRDDDASRRPIHVRRRSTSARAARSSRASRCPGWSSGPGPFPPYVESAAGAHFRCVDGHDYVDFCLGDTGAMAGHGPAPTIAAVERGMRRGITHMLPTEDAAWVGEELTRRFGVGSWQFALSASDANRWVLRLARLVTGRSKVVVHDHCYHGSVDEAIAMLGPDGSVVPVRGSVGPQVDVAETTRVVEFNDIDGLEAALADGDVAAVLIEPALTNVGIVLPEPGYHAAVREITRRTGTLLVIDETHTICAGPGGATAPVGSRAGHRRHRQDHRRRDPVGGVRLQPGGRGPRRRLDRGRGFRRRRDRRDAGRLRPVAGRDAGHARRGPDGRGVRADDPARRALGSRRGRRPSAMPPCPGM